MLVYTFFLLRGLPDGRQHGPIHSSEVKHNYYPLEEIWMLCITERIPWGLWVWGIAWEHPFSWREPLHTFYNKHKPFTIVFFFLAGGWLILLFLEYTITYLVNMVIINGECENVCMCVCMHEDSSIPEHLTAGNYVKRFELGKLYRAEKNRHTHSHTNKVYVQIRSISPKKK